MNLPEPIAQLIEALHKLPGIGPRSAERLALHLVQSEAGVTKQLAQLLVQARERIRNCSICGSLTESDPCSICSDSRRDASLVCLVERATDIITVEKPGTFRGKYHVLGGKISPLNGVEPEDLRIAELEKRLVIALGTDVEGDATSHYIAKRLTRPGLLVTRIAHGLPAGSGLEFTDEVTLGHAFAGRREIS